MGISKKERRELTGFNDLKLKIVLIPLFAFFYPILVYRVWPNEEPRVFFECFLIGLLHFIIFWWVDFEIVLRIRKAKQGIHNYHKRLLTTGLALLASTLILTTISHIPDLIWNTIDYRLKIPFFVKFMASLIITIIIIAIYEGWYNFALFKEGEMKNERLLKENVQAQLSALQTQVNPHFLFNSLNTLISVIPENTEVAVAFAQNLSKVYRYLLEIRDKELIPVEEELDCIRAYEYLLKIRFGAGIEILYPDNQNLTDRFILPLSLQMLLENAVKHNVVSQSRPLRVQIQINGDHVMVSNNLQPKTVHEESTKVGLQNIQKRYDLVLNKEVKIERTEQLFTVQIPLVSIKEVQ